MSFKNVLSLIILSLLSLNLYGQCQYTIRLIDLAGDGSDGSSWWIGSNGARYYQYTVPYRANPFKEGYLQQIGASYYDVKITNSRFIDVYYQSVNNSSDHAWLVYDDVGRIVDAVNLTIANNEVTGSPMLAPPAGLVNSRRVRVKCAPTSCSQPTINEAYSSESLGDPNLMVDFCTNVKNNQSGNLYIPVQSFCNQKFKVKDSYYNKALIHNISTISMDFKQLLNGNVVDYQISLQYDFINEAIVPNSIQYNTEFVPVLTPVQLQGKWYINFEVPENIFLPGQLLTTTTYDYDTGPLAKTNNSQYPNVTNLDTLYVYKKQVFATNPQVNISLDANLGCTKRVLLDDLLEGYTPCMVGDINVDELIYKIDFFDLNNNPFLDENNQNVGPILTNAFSGQTIKYRITNQATGLQHEGQILVEDKQGPKLDSLPSGSIPCNHPLFDSLKVGVDEVQTTYLPHTADKQAINQVEIAAKKYQIVYFDVSICDALGIEADCLDNKNVLKNVHFSLPDGSPLPHGIEIEWQNYSNHTLEHQAQKNMACSPIAAYCRRWGVKLRNRTKEKIQFPIALTLTAGYRYHEGNTINGQTVSACDLNPEADWANDCSGVSFELTGSVLRSTNCEFPNIKGTLERTYKVTDGNGMSTFITQNITVTRPTLAELEDVDFEPVTYFCPQATPESIRDSVAAPPIWACNFLPTDNQECDISITYSDSDLMPGCSATSGTIIRTWRVTDFCNSNSRTFNQEIQLEDNTKPIINGYETFFTNRTDSCGQDLLLTLDAEDECSDVSARLKVRYRSYRGVYTNLEYDIINDSVQVPNLPIRIFGPIVFTIIVEDGCGNKVTQKFERTLRDDQPPICNVKEDITAEIQEDGIATVCLSDIDMGTTDNCGLYLTEISPDSCMWDSCMTFTCEDPSPSIIVYRARDIFGNVCVKNIRVHIIDNNLPDVDNLPNYTVDCDDPRLDDVVNSFPFPRARIACGEAKIRFDSLFQSQDTCNGYFFVRYFTASDMSGNELEARDTIFVQPSEQFYLVSYPSDTVLTDCNGTLPSDVDVIRLNKCQEVFATQRDSVVQTNGACNVIYRIFEVRNPCLLEGVDNPDPDIGEPNGDGYFLDDDGYQRYIQKIEIQDTIHPVFTNCTSGDTTKLSADENCQARLLRSIDATDNCEVTKISYAIFQNDMLLHEASSNILDTTLGQGNYVLRWSAVDACQNNTECEEYIEIQDNTAPTCSVISPFQAFWDEDGNLTIDASQINDGTTDNCGIDSLAIRTISGDWSSQVVLNCKTSSDTLLFQAIDQAGNSCTDTLLLDIRDTIAPKITIQNVEISCDDTRITTPEVFDFPTAEDSCSDVTVQLQRTASTFNGCDAYEIIRTFEVDDNNASTPTQIVNDTIFVRPSGQFYLVSYPSDTVLTDCNGSLASNVDIILLNNCQRVTVTQRDSMVSSKGACNFIYRIFEVRNPCLLEGVDNPDPDIGQPNGNGYFLDDDGYQRYIQKIEVQDTIAPVFTNCNSGDTTRLSVDENCQSQLIRSVDATDNCIVTEYTYALFQNDILLRVATANSIDTTLEQGNYILRWSVVDACRNSTECTEYIEIKDNTAPNCKVISPFEAFWDEDGNLSIDVSQINDGTTDNCGLDSLAIRTISGDWSSQVDLNCRTSSDTLLFQAIDQSGNVCSDTVILDILDTIAPKVTIQNTEIPCDDARIATPEIFDFPTAEDACSEVVIRLRRTESTFTGCGSFDIIRTFEVEDNNDNTPEQIVKDTIFIRDTSSYTVQFPNDTSGIACDVTFNSMPIISNEGSCSDIRVETSDTIVQHSPCLRRIRIIEVIDNCRFQAGVSNPDKGMEIAPGVFMDDDGYQVDTQIIDLIDTVAPVLVSCPDTITPSPTTNTEFCSGPFEYTFSAEDNCTDVLTYQFQILDDNGAIVFRGATNEIDIQLNAGWYDIVQIAFDACGNSDTCTSKVQLIDRQNPQVISANRSFNLDEFGQIRLGARDLVLVSDNCTAAEDIDVFFLGTDNVPFDSIMLDCSNIGQNGRLVFATDSTGNGGFVFAVFQITDTNTVCSDASAVGVEGRIRTEDSAPLQQVEAKIGNTIEISDAQGYYSFDGLNTNDNYQLSLQKQDDRLKGISVMDLVLLQRHLLGLDTLNGPNDLLVADVNMDGMTSFSDLYFMHQTLLQKDDSKHNRTGFWHFADENDMAISPSNTFSLGRMKTSIDKNYLAFKVGDIDRSILSVAPRSKQTATISVPNKVIEEGWVSIPVRSKTALNMAGFQLNLAHETEAIEFISAFDNTPNMWMDKSIGQNNLKAVLIMPEAIAVEAGQLIFTLRIKAAEGTTVKDIMKLVDESMASQIVEQNDKGWQHTALELEFVDEIIASDKPELYQNKPNPFSSETVISFYMSKSGDATISVFDAQGRVLYKVAESWSKGLHNHQLPNVFRKAGVYYYRLDADAFSATRKMVYLNN